MSESSSSCRCSTGSFVDLFQRDLRGGSVIGSATTAGIVRGGVDPERVMSVDHGALRIRPLLHQAWGRAVLAYGPYRRGNGLMFAAMVLNGHNTSQAEHLPESFKTRLVRWLLGHEAERSDLVRRALHWLRHPRRRALVQKLRTWRWMASGGVVPLDENLAVGWSPTDRPQAPDGGDTFVMHAGLGNNGELWASCSSKLVPVAAGVQNLPLCYVTILRDRGAAYYLASLPGANSAGPYPAFRPLAIDQDADEEELFAVVHQACLGQIGFRVDTRVYGAAVRSVPELGAWFGTAHAADRLHGEDPLEGRSAECGGPWEVLVGAANRRSSGTEILADQSLAVLDPGSPTGLLHLTVERLDHASCGLVWRCLDADNHLRVEVSCGEMRLVEVRQGQCIEIARAAIPADTGRSVIHLQASDDGRTVRCIVDGQLVLTADVPSACLGTVTRVGIWGTASTDMRLVRFEAHPALVDLGAWLDFPSPWFEIGGHLEISDDFTGPAGDLAGRTTTHGGARWGRVYGRGGMVLSGDGDARVHASVDRPNPGNIAYVVDWGHPEFVDVSVDITPPGTGLGEGERGRGGLIIYDDADNFLTISMYVDDSYDGASIAIFSHLDGFEDIYDAVWSMVADKIYWGRTHRLRVVTDGLHVLVFIDAEPVLYRAVTDIYPDRGPMSINKVGIVANWEWGDDTGTVFRNFTAASRGA